MRSRDGKRSFRGRTMKKRNIWGDDDYQFLVRAMKKALNSKNDNIFPDAAL